MSSVVGAAAQAEVGRFAGANTMLREIKLHYHRRCRESVRSASEFGSRPASSEEQMREAIAPMLEAAMPPIAHRNARRVWHGRSHLITHANERESR
jgi:hypothetical protein